jgi:hypothetical protein
MYEYSGANYAIDLSRVREYGYGAVCLVLGRCLQLRVQFAVNFTGRTAGI